MDIILICPRGHREAVDPGRIKASARCSKCGKDIELLTKGDEHAGATWLIVARQGALPHMATPLPAGKKLRLGAASNLWLSLEGDGVANLHAELELQSAQRIHVRNLAEEGKTWIDRALVLEGIIGPDSEMRVGDYALRVGSSTLVQRLANADSAPVVVVEDEADESGNPLLADHEDRPRLPRRSSGRFEGWSTGLKLRVAGCALLTVGCLGYLGWAFLFPAVSTDMPTDTAYTCPEDGTQFRGDWSPGPPKCPNCGALCFGSVRYDLVAPEKPATTQPAPQPTAATPEIHQEPET